MTPVHSVVHRYEVADPQTVCSVDAPSIVGSEPFNIRVGMMNEGEVPAVVDIALTNQQTGATMVEPLTVPAHETHTVDFTEQITEDTNYAISVMGDHNEDFIRTVTYGLGAQISITPESYYTEGDIEIPYNITNTGLLSATYAIEFSLYDQADRFLYSVTNSHYLYQVPGTNSAEGLVGFDLYEGTYTVKYNTIGDEGEISFQVVLPQGTLSMDVSDLYPDGEIQIPYLLENTGLVSSAFELTFNLTKDGESIETFQNTAYLNCSGDDPLAPDYLGITYSGNIQSYLSSGSYVIEAFIGESLSETGSFQVIPREAVEIDTNFGNTTEGKIPVSISVYNGGFDPFSGTVQIETDFGSDEIAIAPIPSGEDGTFDFLIDLFAATPGENEIRTFIYNASGNLIDIFTAPFSVNGPEMVITQFPTYSQFPAGGTGTLTFGVRNEGDQEGHMALRVQAFEGGETKSDYLDTAEEKGFTFVFPIPEDLEERDYQALYSLRQILGGEERIMDEGLITFKVMNVKIEVMASLDQALYSPGDTAHLTLDINNIGSVSDVPLITRINYDGFEAFDSFTLSDTNSILEFDIPIDSFDGRLLYEVMMETGRSIYINTMYIHERHDRIWLSTDKQTYLPGEEVNITVEAGEEGTADITALYGDFTHTVSLTPNTPATFSMSLPLNLIGGTQIIDYDFKEVSHVYQFDVDSFQAEFIEVKLDKSQYHSTDTIHVEFQLLTNADMDGYLDGFIEDPDGWLIPSFTYYGDFTKGLNEFTAQGDLDTDQTGIHKLFYVLYKDEERTQLMTLGSEAFDVEGFALTQLLTDKSQYEYGHEDILVSAYCYGDIEGTADLDLNEETILTQSVASSGFNTLEFTIPADQIPSPGSQILSVILRSNGLESSQETSIEVKSSNNAPIAEANGPYSGTAGRRVYFNSSGSSDPDGDSLTYYWDFGDSESSTDPNPSHIYHTRGSYTATLTISDGDLTATDSASIIVDPPDTGYQVHIDYLTNWMRYQDYLYYRPDYYNQFYWLNYYYDQFYWLRYYYNQYNWLSYQYDQFRWPSYYYFQNLLPSYLYSRYLTLL
ncbi:MAG: PKD domain-containing protein, partial [bacterium]